MLLQVEIVSSAGNCILTTFGRDWVGALGSMASGTDSLGEPELEGQGATVGRNSVREALEIVF